MTKIDKKIIGDVGNTSSRLYLVVNGKIVDEKIDPKGGTKGIIAKHGITKPESLTELAQEAETSETARALYNRQLKDYNTRKAGIYASEMRQRLGDWLKEGPKISVVLCGAIGSREGWTFVPYLKCPVDVTTLSENLYTIPEAHMGELKGRDVKIVHGVRDMHKGRPFCMSYRGAHYEISGDHQSIMRGEEVKAAGIYDKLQPDTENLVCMPGTHSQWLSMTGPTINSFWSFRTGEMFDNMGKPTCTLHDVLRIRTGDEKARWQSFFEGVHAIGDANRGVLAATQGVRASDMTEEKGPRSPVDYLSGIMVASEIKEGMDIFGKDMPLTLIINPGRKGDFYRAAFDYFKWPITQEFNGDEISLKGLIRVGTGFAERPVPKPPAALRHHTA